MNGSLEYQDSDLTCESFDRSRARCQIDTLQEALEKDSSITRVKYELGAYEVDLSDTDQKEYRDFMRASKPFIIVGGVDQKEFSDDFVPNADYYEAAKVLLRYETKLDQPTRIWLAGVKNIIKDMASGRSWTGITENYRTDDRNGPKGARNILLAFLRVLNVVPDLKKKKNAIHLSACSIKLVLGTTTIGEDEELDGVPDERYAYMIACPKAPDEVDFCAKYPDDERCARKDETVDETYCRIYPDDCTESGDLKKIKTSEEKEAEREAKKKADEEKRRRVEEEE